MNLSCVIFFLNFRAPKETTNGLEKPSSTFIMRGFNWLEYAEVAELVDAHDSGSCLGNQVEVQVLSSAPTIIRGTLLGEVLSGG